MTKKFKKTLKMDQKMKKTSPIIKKSCYLEKKRTVMMRELREMDKAMRFDYQEEGVKYKNPEYSKFLNYRDGV